jgi:transcription antitermination factor NusG
MLQIYSPHIESRQLSTRPDFCRGAAWYTIYTTARHEKQVAKQLQLRGLEYFLPLYRVQRRWNDGTRAVLDLPLFPCYLFVRIRLSDRIRVLEIPGLVGLVNGTGGQPATLPEEEMDALRRGLAERRAEPHPLLMVGQRARIRAGALSGLEGVMVRKGNNCRVVLTLHLIMRSVSVEVGLNDLEVLPIAS